MKNKNAFFLLVVFFVTACADGSEQVVISTGPEAVAPEEQRVFEETEDDAPVSAEELVETKELAIQEKLVTFGHNSTVRAARAIDTIIIHSVYNPFAGDIHSIDEIITIFSEYDVAPHYIIERDGNIVKTVPEHIIAWHGGRSRVPDGRTNVNDFSIGIELINSLEDIYTDEQYSSLRTLIEDIQTRYSIKYVLGHDEIKVEDPWNFDWEQINEYRHEAR